VRLAVYLIVMLASSAQADPRPTPQTPRDVLRSAPQLVDIQAAPQFTFLANKLSQAFGQLELNGSLADAFSPGASGPTLLTSAQSVGQGKFSLGTAASTSRIDFNRTQDLVLGRGDDLVVQTLGYHLELWQSVLFLLATYGLWEDFDATLTLPFVWTNTKLDVSRGGAGREVRLNAAAQGDLTLRLKYYLQYNTSVGLLFSFPTGVPAKLTSTGDYWVAMFATHTTPIRTCCQLTGNAGINFDLNDVAASEATYGLGFGAILITERLGLTVEVAGRSQLEDQATIQDTGVLTIDGVQPLLGVDFARRDLVSLAVTFRVPLGHGFIALVGVSIPLTHPDFSPEAATPILGFGGTW
jgi:hypothetical protein